MGSEVKTDQNKEFSECMQYESFSEQKNGPAKPILLLERAEAIRKGEATFSSCFFSAFFPPSINIVS